MRKYRSEIKKAIIAAISEGILCNSRNGIIIVENTEIEINLCVEHRKDYEFVRFFYIDEWNNEINVETAFVQSPFHSDYSDMETAIYESAINAIRKVNKNF